MTRALGPLLLSLTFAACSSATQWTVLDLEKLPSAKDFPDAGAVILLDRQVLEFKEVDGKTVYDATHHRRLKILGDDGRKAASLVEFYDTTFSTVLALDARIIKPNGDTKRFTRKDAVDLMAHAGFVLYADSRALTLDLTDCPLGTVVEYRYVARHNDPRLSMERMFFGSRYPVVRAELEVRTPDGWSIDHRAVRLQEVFDWAPKTEQMTDGRTRHLWAKDDIAPTRKEPYGPRLFETFPHVAIRLAKWTEAGKTQSAFQSQEEFSKWMYQLQSGTSETDDEMKKLAAKVVGNAKEPREKAKKLYEYVQREVRYVAVEIGLGGWRPYTAKEVMETKYGDCKDKANFLRALLSTQNIESNLASLYSHDGFPHKFLLPTIGNTNHAILIIDLPGGSVIADPTERSVPFGELPLRDQEAELLRISPKGAKAIKVAATGPDINQRTLRIDIGLDEKGKAKGTFGLELSGSYVARLRSDLIGENEDAQHKSLKKWTLLTRGSVKNSTVSEPRPKGRTHGLKVEGELEIDNVAEASGPVQLIRLSDIVYSDAEPLPKGPRQFPIVWSQAKTSHIAFSISLPKGARVSKLPEPVHLDAGFAKYDLEWTQEGEKLRVKRNFVINSRILPASDYSKFKKLFDDILTAEARAIVVKGS